MGLFSDLFGNKTKTRVRVEQQNTIRRTQRKFSPEEFVIYEQENSGEEWHGVPLSELSKTAQKTYRGKYVKVDERGFLVFHYTSRSGKTRQSIQCKIDENGLLKAMPHGYYPGQRKDSSDDFIEMANQRFRFF